MATWLSRAIKMVEGTAKVQEAYQTADGLLMEMGITEGGNVQDRIKIFQSQHNIPLSGELDETTVAALYAAYKQYHDAKAKTNGKKALEWMWLAGSVMSLGLLVLIRRNRKRR